MRTASGAVATKKCAIAAEILGTSVKILVHQGTSIDLYVCFCLRISNGMTSALSSAVSISPDRQWTISAYSAQRCSRIGSIDISQRCNAACASANSVHKSRKSSLCQPVVRSSGLVWESCVERQPRPCPCQKLPSIATNGCHDVCNNELLAASSWTESGLGSSLR